MNFRKTPPVFPRMQFEAVVLPPARKALSLLADQMVDTQKKIEGLTADIRADATVNEAAQRLQMIPGHRSDHCKRAGFRLVRYCRFQIGMPFQLGWVRFQSRIPRGVKSSFEASPR